MSGIFGSSLLILFFVAAILYVMFSHPRGLRPRAVLLASLAGRWNGKVREGGLFLGDSLELEVDGIAGTVTFGERTHETTIQGGWTRVRFHWPTDRRLRATPETFRSQVRRFLGSNDIQFDDPYFDDRFWVESSHPTWARQILTRESRINLVQLRWPPSGGAGDNVVLDIGPQGLSLRVERVVVDHPDTLAGLVELAITLLQSARGVVEAVGVHLEEVRIPVGSACPACGHGIDLARLTCPRCKTPHHLDCWKYLGGCAIFACQGRVRRTP